MLSLDTGDITFEEPAVALGPGLTLDAFRDGPAGRSAKLHVANDPYTSWKLAGPHALELSFRVTAWFHAQRLYRVHLLAVDPTTENTASGSWDDWSEAQEMQRKTSHDRWMARHTGGQSLFDWGEVVSRYDDRAGMAFLDIRYGFQPR
ncbi:MAG: hypothetical protein AAGA57_02620 [Planctomycetota bacterium]